MKTIALKNRTFLHKLCGRVQRIYANEVNMVKRNAANDYKKYEETIDSDNEYAFRDSMIQLFKMLMKFSTGGYYTKSIFGRTMFTVTFYVLSYQIIKLIYLLLIVFAFMLKDVQI